MWQLDQLLQHIHRKGVEKITKWLGRNFPVNIWELSHLWRRVEPTYITHRPIVQKWTFLFSFYFILFYFIYFFYISGMGVLVFLIKKVLNIIGAVLWLLLNRFWHNCTRKYFFFRSKYNKYIMINSSLAVMAQLTTLLVYASNQKLYATSC